MKRAMAAVMLALLVGCSTNDSTPTNTNVDTTNVPNTDKRVAAGWLGTYNCIGTYQFMLVGGNLAPYPYRSDDTISASSRSGDDIVFVMGGLGNCQVRLTLSSDLKTADVRENFLCQLDDQVNAARYRFTFRDPSYLHVDLASSTRVHISGSWNGDVDYTRNGATLNGSVITSGFSCDKISGPVPALAE